MSRETQRENQVGLSYMREILNLKKEKTQNEM